MGLSLSLIELLSSDTQLLSLIGEGDVARIFPLIIPQKRAVQRQLPCIVYTLTGEDRAKTYCATLPLVRAEMQFDSYGMTLDGAGGATDVSSALQGALLDFRGHVGNITIADVALNGRMTAVDMEPGLMRVVDMYSIWYTED